MNIPNILDAPRSKSKERPHIPKLNLDYSYLEKKCKERDLMEQRLHEINNNYGVSDAQFQDDIETLQNMDNDDCA